VLGIHVLPLARPSPFPTSRCLSTPVRPSPSASPPVPPPALFSTPLLLLLQGILAQAEDRIHRIGQRAPRVDIAYLVGHGTGAGRSGAGGSAGADASASFDDRLWRMVADKLETLHSALDAGPSATAAPASGAAAAAASGVGAAASSAGGGRGGRGGAGRAGGRGGRAGGEGDEDEDGAGPEEEQAVAVTAMPDGLFDDLPPPRPVVARVCGGAGAGAQYAGSAGAASSASAAAACAGSGAVAGGAAPVAVPGTDAVRFFVGGAAGQGQTTMTSHFQRAAGQLSMQRTTSGLAAAGGAGAAVGGGGGVSIAAASAPRQPGAASVPAAGLAFQGVVASAAADIARDFFQGGGPLPAPAPTDPDAPFASSTDLLEVDADFEAALAAAEAQALAAAEAQALAAMSAGRPAAGVAGTHMAPAGPPPVASFARPQQPSAGAASMASARSAAAHAVVAGPRPMPTGCAVPPQAVVHGVTLAGFGPAGSACGPRSAVRPALSAAMPKPAHGLGSGAPAAPAPWPDGNHPRWPAAGGRGPIGAAVASTAGRDASIAPAARSLPGFQSSGSGLPGVGRPLAGSGDRR